MSVGVTVDRLSKRFGTFAALDGVSLGVESGELVALLGPSGSGKTTLLRIVAGLEQADSGRVLFEGEDATQLSLRDRRIGFVFQSYALFRHMTVADNVAFGLRARPRRERPAESDIRRRVGELLDLVQLSGLDKRFPSQLSGGQRQRVALARALAIEPRVLLLDEPFGALDAKVRKDLRRWLRELHDRTGHTTLFVTHDQDEALELADRVAILHQGRLEQIDTPDAVYDHPASPFVCEFLGETNRIPVEVGNDQIYFQERPVLAAPSQGPKGRASLYVRPQDLRILAPSQPGLSGIVAEVRRHGAQRRAAVTVAGLGAPLDIDLDSRATPAVGEPVALGIARGSVFQA
jgi:sulfate transport system ATP-binding protein